MRKLIKIFLLLGLIAIVLTGCFSDGNEKENGSGNQDKLVDNIKDPPITEPSTKDQEDNEPSQVDTSEKYVKFNEAFPDSILGSPEEFIEKTIPGFKVGISSWEAENILGKPDFTEFHQNEWETWEDWIYENVNDYKLIISFDSEGYMSNFKLIKQLSGKGIIPKITNKPIPESGSPVTYTELGFEGVLLGTKTGDVINRFGEPLQTYISYDEMYGYTLAMVYQGVTVHVLLESERPYVQLIEANDLGIVETYRGIKVGSSVNDVITKYGEPAYDWKEVGDLVYGTEDYWFAIKFHIEDEKVIRINIYEAS